ncbi:hypothetical protein G0P98_25970 [Yangia sp. PrR004]|nr:hypothetical protein [Salipiger sp. PrR004]
MSKITPILTAAVFMIFAASELCAEVPGPDWLPKVLEFPEDTEVVTSREIGSSMRLLRLATTQDAGELLGSWRSALLAAGYTVREPQVDLDALQLSFSGKGINNAQIAVPNRGQKNRTMIEIDATLDD